MQDINEGYLELEHIKDNHNQTLEYFDIYLQPLLTEAEMLDKGLFMKVIACWDLAYMNHKLMNGSYKYETKDYSVKMHERYMYCHKQCKSIIDQYIVTSENFGDF